MRLVRAPDGRLVAILGEAHLKLARAAALGHAVVSAFELRGVETFQRERVVWGRALAFFLNAPRHLLRALSLGAVKGSTIVDAKQLPSGHTIELERAEKMPFGLHVASIYMTLFFTVALLAVPSLIVPEVARAILVLVALFDLHLLMLVPAIILRRRRWSWILHPFLGILSPRDELMAAGTVRMLEDHTGPRAAVVVMGRAHVGGFERSLVERHGFTRVAETWKSPGF